VAFGLPLRHFTSSCPATISDFVPPFFFSSSRSLDTIAEKVLCTPPPPRILFDPSRDPPRLLFPLVLLPLFLLSDVVFIRFSIVHFYGMLNEGFLLQRAHIAPHPLPLFIMTAGAFMVNVLPHLIILIPLSTVISPLRTFSTTLSLLDSFTCMRGASPYPAVLFSPRRPLLPPRVFRIGKAIFAYSSPLPLDMLVIPPFFFFFFCRESHQRPYSIFHYPSARPRRCSFACSRAFFDGPFRSVRVGGMLRGLPFQSNVPSDIVALFLLSFFSRIVSSSTDIASSLVC